MNARIDQGPSPLQSAQNWSTQVEGDTSAASQLPGATLRTSTSPSALINSQEMFKSFVQGEVDKMIGSVSGSAAQMLGEIASDTLNAIMDKTFGRLQGELVASQGQGMTSDPIAMMQSAHTEATELLDMLKESTSKQSFNTTPQLVKGEDNIACPAMVNFCTAQFREDTSQPFMQAHLGKIILFIHSPPTQQDTLAIRGRAIIKSYLFILAKHG